MSIYKVSKHAENIKFSSTNHILYYKFKVSFFTVFINKVLWHSITEKITIHSRNKISYWIRYYVYPHGRVVLNPGGQTR